MNYNEYRLWERELIFKQLNKDLPEPKYAIVWEDPSEPDEPLRITVPSPTWLAMALHGDILPPVEVYWELKKDEAKPDFKYHTKGYLLHDTPPIPAMTEEQAMEYLIQKDIPPHVWYGYNGNRKIIKIVPRNLIPTNREFRNAWRIKQDVEDDNGTVIN